MTGLARCMVQFHIIIMNYLRQLTYKEAYLAHNSGIQTQIRWPHFQAPSEGSVMVKVHEGARCSYHERRSGDRKKTRVPQSS